MRIGEAAFDRGDPAGGAGDENIPADRREVGIEAKDEFARGFDPLPREGGDEPQQHRLVFEQPPETAAFHFGDELIVARCEAGGLRRRAVAAARAAFAPDRSARRAPAR